MEKTRSYKRALTQRGKAAVLITIIFQRGKIKVDTVKRERAFTTLSVNGPPYQKLIV